VSGTSRAAPATRQRLAFTAVIRRVGILRCVELPPAGATWLQGRAVSVVGSANGVAFRSTLMPRRGGGYRLFLSGPVRRAGGVDTGDTVRVLLRPGAPPRRPNLPADFATALKATPMAWGVFAGLTPRLQQQILRYVMAARRPATRTRRNELLALRFATGSVRL
jgi:hypothetical protein